MNEIILLVIALILFFFGYEISPRIATKNLERKHLVELMFMAVTITTILIPLISLIASGTIAIGMYFLVVPILTGYLIYYGIKHGRELQGKSRKTLIGFSLIYAYIFVASGYLMALFGPFMPNIKL